MANSDTQMTGASNELSAAAERAIRAIPPAWPLTTAVAVNPYFGQAHEPLAKTSARIARVAGAPTTMPRAWYAAKIARGEITDADLNAALTAQSSHSLGLDSDAVKAAASEERPARRALENIAELAAEVSGINWPGLIEDRIGAWASGYFDSGQALWAAPKSEPAYETWRAAAIHDLTPEIAGLKGFATTVSRAPLTAPDALAIAGTHLGLTGTSAETYFHGLMIGLAGWAQYARHLLWQAELAGSTDETLRDLLVIRLIWEQALLDRYGHDIGARWDEVLASHAAALEPNRYDLIDAVLQEAAERAAQRALVATIESPDADATETRPKLQAAFCIDVRSEIFRRALEGVDPDIQTLGFAGFFGLAAAHRGFASDVVEARLPVLLTPQVETRSGGRIDKEDDLKSRITARASRAWGRFKLAAVSSFAFVEAAGPLYVGKLIRDSLGLEASAAPAEPRPRLDPEIDATAALDAAETILRAMSLTDNFARVVLLAGHGATVANNPHASALQCGACGGYSGEVNARLLASLLNADDVRAGLSGRGISIPEDTVFIGALHDTTTDTVTLYDRDQRMPDHSKDLDAARKALAAAGQITRGERAKRLPNAADSTEILRRSRDWAEVRPEWALAGCQAFIAAPRQRTSGLSLDGRAFLHDYDWRADTEFKVLELIMTAPVVVASWISLQYYGSSVAPGIFGAGNKLLHNVTGGIGVVEGNGGRLRVGLPWQSVHDGDGLVHEPLRLAVVVEAPTEAMTDIIARHQLVRDLFDNRWLHLLAIDDAGKVHARYAGNLTWQATGSALEAAA